MMAAWRNPGFILPFADFPAGQSTVGHTVLGQGVAVWRFVPVATVWRVAGGGDTAGGRRTEGFGSQRTGTKRLCCRLRRVHQSHHRHSGADIKW